MLQRIKTMFKSKTLPKKEPSYTYIWRNEELDFHIYISTTDKAKNNLVRTVGIAALIYYNNNKD